MLAEQFNRVFGQEMQDVRDFLILHYHRTAGRAEPMWRERQDMEIPETLARKIAHFEQSGRIVLSTDELFRDASWFAVLDGQGVVPRGYNPMIDGAGSAGNLRHLEAVRGAIRESTAKIPAIPPRAG